MAKTTRKNVKLVGNNGNEYDATQTTTTGRKGGRNSWAVKITIRHNGEAIFWQEATSVRDAKAALNNLTAKHGCRVIEC